MDEATTEEHLDQSATLEAEPEDVSAPEMPEASATDASEEPDAETVNPDTEAADEQDVSDAPASAASTDLIPLRRGGRRALRIIAAVLGAGLLLFLAGVAYATYDFKNEHDGKLLPGTKVGGVDVGGMNRQEAIRAVRGSLGPKLDRSITVSFGERDWDVTPRELGARSTAKSAVDAALDESESASWVDLASIRFLDDELDVSQAVAIRYPKKGINEFVGGLRDEVNAEPRDAELDYSSGWVETRKERVGYQLREKATASALLAAVRDDRSTAELEVRELKPEVTADSFDQVLLLRQGDYTLYMYEDGEITHQWPVAIGTGGYPTPTGEYSVELKRYMPTWVNPDPTGWGASMPDMIPPGPDNPLGVRAINWTAPAIRFHGTSATSSIGTAASHGCVRMYNEDVIELYDLVEVGTPIISIWG